MKAKMKPKEIKFSAEELLGSVEACAKRIIRSKRVPLNQSEMQALLHSRKVLPPQTEASEAEVQAVVRRVRARRK
jgi:hypothetical protein